MTELPTPAALCETAKASLNCYTPWEVAYHEAGHVVAEWVVARSTPDAVYLNDDPDDVSHAGRTISRSFMAIPVGSWPEDTDKETLPLLEAQTMKYGTVLAAGKVATHLARSWKVDPGEMAFEVIEDEVAAGSDEAALAELVKNLAPGLAEDWLEGRYEQAEAVLSCHWDEVQRLTVALIDRRCLDGDDLWELLAAPDDRQGGSNEH